MFKLKGEFMEKEFYGACSYCNKMKEDLRTIKYKSSIKEKWQPSKKDVCCSCREYLKGLFKYV